VIDSALQLGKRRRHGTTGRFRLTLLPLLMTLDIPRAG
jgi:hypothetical protein